MNAAICRRVVDCPEMPGTRDVCQSCMAEVIVEEGLENNDQKLCIYCAAQSQPESVLFVELPPDEFGHRSMAKGIQEVLGARNGEWHKTGVWHDPKWVLARQES